MFSVSFFRLFLLPFSCQYFCLPSSCGLFIMLDPSTSVCVCFLSVYLSLVPLSIHSLVSLVSFSLSLSLSLLSLYIYISLFSLFFFLSHTLSVRGSMRLSLSLSLSLSISLARLLSLSLSVLGIVCLLPVTCERCWPHRSWHTGESPSLSLAPTWMIGSLRGVLGVVVSKASKRPVNVKQVR